MKNNSEHLALYDSYQNILLLYLTNEDESNLIDAYELGKEFVSQGNAMISLINFHQDVVAKWMEENKFSNLSSAQLLKKSSNVLSEFLTHFETEYSQSHFLNKEMAEMNTELKNAQKEIRDSNKKMLSLIENLPGGAIYVEDDLLTVNRAVETITGFPKNRLITLIDWFALLYPGDEHKEMQCYIENRKIGKLSSFNIVFNRCDAVEKHLHISVHHDESFDIWLISDVTEQIQGQIQLNQSAKMASLGQMAGGMAHEINNPLAIIKGKAQFVTSVINKGNFDNELVLKNLLTIEQTVDRIAKIIKGLRSFARDSAKDPFRAVKLQTIIDETLSFCSSKFKNHSVNLELNSNHPDVDLECRSVEVSQVILNLLNNSFDAIHEQPQCWVKIETNLVAEGVEISVTDSGEGIPLAVRKKLMQPFFTTKEVGKGTGLGLSICRGLVEVHGGRFYLDEKSKNTRFVIWLPLMQKITKTNAA